MVNMLVDFVTVQIIANWILGVYCVFLAGTDNYHQVYNGYEHLKKAVILRVYSYL